VPPAPPVKPRRKRASTHHKEPSRVESLKPIDTDYYAFDTDTIGFGVRVRAAGGMSCIVLYKAGSGRRAPTRRVTLGSIGKMTPEQARKAAEKVLGSVAHGEDPAADKAALRRSQPLSELIEAFLAEHAVAERKASTVKARASERGDCARNGRSYLGERRILTTKLHVTGPFYAHITAQLVIARNSDAVADDVTKAINKNLKDLLNSLPSDNGQGWPFGRDVFVSEVYETLEKIPGIDCPSSEFLRHGAV
jgi:hypothetical protein